MNRADGAKTSTTGQPDLAELKAAYEKASSAAKRASKAYDKAQSIYWRARLAYRSAEAELAGEPTEEQKQAERAHLAAIFGPLDPLAEGQDGDEVSPSSPESGPAEG
ncbi:MAG: hypothetical protein ACYCZN_09725 [Candidatus Dormibacteria bacterium]